MTRGRRGLGGGAGVGAAVPCGRRAPPPVRWAPDSAWLSGGSGAPAGVAREPPRWATGEPTRAWRPTRRTSRHPSRARRVYDSDPRGSRLGTRVGPSERTTRIPRGPTRTPSRAQLVYDSDPEDPTRAPSRAPSCATRNTSRHATVRLNGTSRRTGGPTGCARGAASRGKRVRLGTRARARVGPSLHCALAGTCSYPS